MNFVEFFGTVFLHKICKRLILQIFINHKLKICKFFCECLLKLTGIRLVNSKLGTLDKTNFTALPRKTRRSRVQMFLKIGVLKNFAKCTGKDQRWNQYSTKLQDFMPATLLKCFLVNCCETFIEHLSTTHLRKNVSGNAKRNSPIHKLYQRSEVHLEPFEICGNFFLWWSVFGKIVVHSFIFFEKGSVVDIWQGYKYAYDDSSITSCKSPPEKVKLKLYKTLLF